MRPTAPRCKWHDKPMRAELQSRPRFAFSNPETRRLTRKVYRCKVLGCHFCAIVEQAPDPVWETMGQGREYMRHF